MSVSDSAGLVYFTVGLVEFIHHLNNNWQEEGLDEFVWGNLFHSSHLTEFFGAFENYFWVP